MKYQFKILRYDPKYDDDFHFQEYTYEPDMSKTVLEALLDIRDQQDPTLSFRYSCGEAICGSCGMVVNGRITLVCRTPLDQVKSDQVVVEPLPNLEVLKDLVVDMNPFWEAYRAVEPYMHPEGEVPEKGHRITEREMEEIYQFINCILCGCCFSACPVASRDGAYKGPAALAKLCRFVDDPRDKRSFENWSRVDSPDGVWGCDTVFRCNDVCPKNVRPADGIETLRRKLVVGKIKRIFKK